MATKVRIQQAVASSDWQRYRIAMKGLYTETKLRKLEWYWVTQHSSSAGCWRDGIADLSRCDICIRVDNYIKALCRGGQLHKGESLQTALAAEWNLRIKR